LFGYIVATLVNVLVPQVPFALIFRSCTPGVVTAVLINLPAMTYLAVRAVRKKWVSGWKDAAFGAGVPLFAAAAISALFFV